MSLWCCQNSATFHELLETTNRLLLNIFGGKLFLEAAPIPPLPTSCLKPLRWLLTFWDGQCHNFAGWENQLPANDKVFLGSAWNSCIAVWSSNIHWEFRSGEPPKSRIRVGFGFRVSGFGFRRLKPTFAVGFGFRVSSLETNFRCRFRVSGFGFRRLKPTFAVGFGFRVSIGPGEVQSSESVSGFGFRVSIGPGEGKSSESVSGFGFRVSIGPGEVKSSESVSGFGFRSSKPTLTVGFGFRWSKPTLQTSLRITSLHWGSKIFQSKWMRIGILVASPRCAS